jgi:Rieske Fe-S protein
MKVSRRAAITTFARTFALGAAYSTSPGNAWAQSFLLDVQQLPDFTPGVLKINLNDFPVLSQPRSSVRLGTAPVASNNTSDETWLKPIIINRGDADDFYVVSAVCTHQGCIVRRMESASQRMVCPCHFSQYQIDGTIPPERIGNFDIQPAQTPLQNYSYTRQGSILLITVPGLFFDVTFNRSPSNARVQLRFVAFYQTKYEIYFRPTLEAPPTLVHFSLTENGPANLTEIAGSFESDYVTLYLDRPGAFGFFQLAVKTSQV